MPISMSPYFTIYEFAQSSSVKVPVYPFLISLILIKGLRPFGSNENREESNGKPVSVFAKFCNNV